MCEFLRDWFGGEMNYRTETTRDENRYKAVERANEIKERTDLTFDEKQRRIKRMYKWLGVKDYHELYYKLYKEFK